MAGSSGAEADALIAEGQAALYRADWASATALAQRLRQMAPQRGAGYQMGAIAARELGDYPRATEFALMAAPLFPGEAWPLAEQARAAQAMGDRAGTIRLVGELLTRFPAQPAGYQIGIALAREMSKFAEADKILEEAFRQFPDRDWPHAFAAANAIESGDAARAVTLAATLRDRFPDNPTGYEVGSQAARALRRLAEARELSAAALRRFPRQSWPLTEEVQNARAIGDINAAIAAAAALRAGFPDVLAGYQYGCRYLRQWGRFDEAEAVARAALARFDGAEWAQREMRDTVRMRRNRADSAYVTEVLRRAPGRMADAAAPLRRVAVVLGTHRAGTSLCANLMHRLGVGLGGPLVAAGFDNPDGFFEHSGVLACHEALLGALDADYDTLIPAAPSPEFWDGEAAAGITRELQAIVAGELARGDGIWGFKDPRAVLFLPLWQRVFAALEVTPIWLLAVRDPGAVAASLHQRDGMPKAHAGLLWADHYLRALAELGPQIALVVHYERWFSAPAAQLRALAGALGVEDEKVIAAAGAAIKPGLQHNVSAPDAAGPLPGLVHGWLLAERPDLMRLQGMAAAARRELATIAGGKSL